MNKIFVFSLGLVFFTWLLLIVGGLVNPMGASMACPDWYFFPTCNGEILPPMKGGVLYEHGHRILASFVGFLTLVLALLCIFSSWVDIFTKKLSLLALFLVILQGTLGGITVLLNLSTLVSIIHLVCGFVFFGLLILITFRLSNKSFSLSQIGEQKSLFLAISITFLQILWGGVVRHMGAGMACGDDLLGCGPELWPSWFLGQIHMAHRFLGYALFFLVLYSCGKIFKKSRSILALVPMGIAFTQVFLGLLAIYSVRNPSVLALHTGFGALMLASLLFLYLSAYNAQGIRWIKQS